MQKHSYRLVSPVAVMGTVVVSTSTGSVGVTVSAGVVVSAGKQTRHIAGHKGGSVRQYSDVRLLQKGTHSSLDVCLRDYSQGNFPPYGNKLGWRGGGGQETQTGEEMINNKDRKQ